MGTTVKTIGSGGDYTTLQSWEDAAPANLVTDGNIWQGQIKAASDSFVGTSGTTLLTISGSTVDSTHYKELTTATGASFRDNASVQTNALRFNASNGCEIRTTNTYSQVITIAENYVRLTKLQIAATGANHTEAVRNTSNTNLRMQFCIAEACPNGSSYKGVVADFGGTGTYLDCLMVSRLASIDGILQSYSGNTVVNCTLVTPSNITAASVGLRGNYGTTTAKNCAIFGVAAVKGGSATFTFTTCDTDVASPPTGCTTRTYDTSYFANITDATRDFRLVSGSAAIDGGTTDSTNAPIDIAATARPSGAAYDVGCWEYVAAASSAPKRLLMMGVG